MSLVSTAAASEAGASAGSGGFFSFRHKTKLPMVWNQGERNASRGRGRVGRKKGGRSRVGKGKRALTKPRGKRAASAAAGPAPAAAGGPAAGGSADRAPQEQEEQAGELPDVQWGQDAGVKNLALATRFERAHRQALEATGCSIYPSSTEEVHIQAPRTEVPYIISSDLTDKENYEKPISVMLSPNGANVFQDTQVRVFSTQRPRETSGGTKPGRHRAQPRWGKETGDAQSVLFIPEAFSPEQADAIAEKLLSAVQHPSNQANIISPIKIDGKLVSIPLGPGVNAETVVGKTATSVTTRATVPRTPPSLLPLQWRLRSSKACGNGWSSLTLTRQQG